MFFDGSFSEINGSLLIHLGVELHAGLNVLIRISTGDLSCSSESTDHGGDEWGHLRLFL